MPDMDRLLYDQLRDRAERISVPAGDADAVMARGRSRRRRSRVVASVAAVVLAGSAGGALAARTHSVHHSTVVFDQPSTSIPAAIHLNWQTQPDPDGLYMETDLSGPGTGTSYAISTAPGLTQPDASGNIPLALYRSSNGSRWSEVSAPAGVSLGGLAVDGNQIYNVGTGLATASTKASPSSATVASTRDGGQSWSESQLPLDYQTDGGALTLNNEVLKVAANSRGVVAAVGAQASLDLGRILPAGTSYRYWAATPQGIDLLGAERADPCGTGESVKAVNAPAPQRGSQVSTVYCYNKSDTPMQTLSPEQAYPVIADYSWQQLGLDRDDAAAIQGQLVVFHSADGKSFQQESIPAIFSNGVASLVSEPSGFALAASGQMDGSTPVVYQSADGQTWTAAPALPSPVSSIDGMGVLGDELTVVASEPGGETVYRLAGDQWLAEQHMDQAASVSFGPLGVAVVTISPNTAAWEVEYSSNGTDWQTGQLAALSGGPVAQAGVAVGGTSVVVTVTRPAPTENPAIIATQVAVVGVPSAG